MVAANVTLLWLTSSHSEHMPDVGITPPTPKRPSDQATEGESPILVGKPARALNSRSYGSNGAGDAPTSPPSQTLTVTVHDERGNSLDDVWVHALRDSAYQVGSGQTNATGTVAFRVEGAVRYLDLYSGDCLHNVERHRRVTLPRHTRSMRVVLRHAHVLRGRVVDSRANPLAFGVVYAEQNHRVVDKAFVHHEGRFSLRLSTNDLADVYYIRDPRMMSCRSVTMAAGHQLGVRPQARELVIAARPVSSQGQLLVRVLDPHGNPVRCSGLTVDTDWPDPVSLGQVFELSASTDANGYATFSHLVRAPTRVMLPFESSRRHPWYAPPRARDLPSIGTSPAVTIQLRQGRLISGRAFKRETIPAAYAQIRAMDRDIELGRCQTDRHGHFAIALDPAREEAVTLCLTHELGTRLEGIRPGDRDVVLTAPPRNEMPASPR